MAVLVYELGCGSVLELIVPASEIRDAHVLGELRVWCYAYGCVHAAEGVRMVRPGAV